MFICLILNAFIYATEAFSSPFLSPEADNCTSPGMMCAPRNQLLYGMPNSIPPSIATPPPMSIGPPPMQMQPAPPVVMPAPGYSNASMKSYSAAPSPTPYTTQPPGNVQFATQCDNSIEKEAFKNCVKDLFKKLKNTIENCKKVLGPNAKECCMDMKCLELLKDPAPGCKDDKDKKDSKDDKKSGTTETTKDDDKKAKEMMYKFMEVFRKIAENETLNKDDDDRCDRKSTDYDDERSRSRKRRCEEYSPKKKHSRSSREEYDDYRDYGNPVSDRPIEKMPEGARRVEKTKIVVVPSKRYDRLPDESGDEDGRLIYQDTRPPPRPKRKNNDHSSYIDEDLGQPPRNSDRRRPENNGRQRYNGNPDKNRQQRGNGYSDYNDQKRDYKHPDYNDQKRDDRYQDSNGYRENDRQPNYDRSKGNDGRQRNDRYQDYDRQQNDGRNRDYNRQPRENERRDNAGNRPSYSNSEYPRDNGARNSPQYYDEPRNYAPSNNGNQSNYPNDGHPPNHDRRNSPYEAAETHPPPRVIPPNSSITPAPRRQEYYSDYNRPVNNAYAGGQSMPASINRSQSLADEQPAQYPQRSNSQDNTGGQETSKSDQNKDKAESKTTKSTDDEDSKPKGSKKSEKSTLTEDSDMSSFCKENKSDEACLKNEDENKTKE